MTPLVGLRGKDVNVERFEKMCSLITKAGIAILLHRNHAPTMRRLRQFHRGGPPKYEERMIQKYKSDHHRCNNYQAIYSIQLGALATYHHLLSLDVDVGVYTQQDFYPGNHFNADEILQLFGFDDHATNVAWLCAQQWPFAHGNSAQPWVDKFYGKLAQGQQFSLSQYREVRKLARRLRSDPFEVHELVSHGRRSTRDGLHIYFERGKTTMFNHGCTAQALNRGLLWRLCDLYTSPPPAWIAVAKPISWMRADDSVLHCVVNYDEGLEGVPIAVLPTSAVKDVHSFMRVGRVMQSTHYHLVTPFGQQTNAKGRNEKTYDVVAAFADMSM